MALCCPDCRWIAKCPTIPSTQSPRILYYHNIPRESRKCVLGMVTRLRVGRSRNCSIPSRGKTSITSPKRPDWLWDPLILMFNGYRMHVPDVQRPMREADHLPPFLRLNWAELYLHSIRLHGMNRDDFIFTITLFIWLYVGFLPSNSRCRMYLLSSVCYIPHLLISTKTVVILINLTYSFNSTFKDEPVEKWSLCSEPNLFNLMMADWSRNTQFICWFLSVYQWKTSCVIRLFYCNTLVFKQHRRMQQVEVMEVKLPHCITRQAIGT
jgi:hypothetical protein